MLRRRVSGDPEHCAVEAARKEREVSLDLEAERMQLNLLPGRGWFLCVYFFLLSCKNWFSSAHLESKFLQIIAVLGICFLPGTGREAFPMRHSQCHTNPA